MPQTRRTVVLFPEAFVSGYPRGLDFGAVVGSRTDAGREDFKRLLGERCGRSGPVIATLSKAARTNSVYLVIGVIERAGGTLYCCVLFFAPDGAFLGKHRKVMPTASERLIWGYGDGSTLRCLKRRWAAWVRSSAGKITCLCCARTCIPRALRLLRSYGRPSRYMGSSMRHIAAEGRCFVSAAISSIAGATFPRTTKTAFGDAPETVISRGGSALLIPWKISYRPQL